MKFRTLAGATALAFLLPAAAARAEVAVGEEAPTFEAADFINTEPLDLSALKGRLVLLELFSTT
jgi:hypothetical protein